MSTNDNVRPLRWTLQGAAEQLGISTRTVRRRIEDGDLDTVSDGHRNYVLDRELRRYAEGRPRETSAA